jgi:hypothetical protein
VPNVSDAIADGLGGGHGKSGKSACDVVVALMLILVGYCVWGIEGCVGCIEEYEINGMPPINRQMPHPAMNAITNQTLECLLELGEVPMISPVYEMNHV